MFEPTIVAAIAGTFVLAGAVKGVIGLGLPTVCLGLLTAVLDLPTAMVLLVVPSFVTNLWQALTDGARAARNVLARIWPFLLAATVTVWAGGAAMTRVDLNLLSALLGALLVIYATLNLAGVRLSIPSRHERWAGPAFGAVNGVLTGMTGSFVVPGVMFLQSIGLGRDQLVQAMGMLFTLSTVALAAALGRNHFVTVELGLVSAAGVIPAILGMVLGRKLRHGLSEQRFKQVFFISITVLGTYFVFRSISG
jgi:uncharacterized membrane protein YfcA